MAPFGALQTSLSFFVSHTRPRMSVENYHSEDDRGGVAGDNLVVPMLLYVKSISDFTIVSLLGEILVKSRCGHMGLNWRMLINCAPIHPRAISTYLLAFVGFSSVGHA